MNAEAKSHDTPHTSEDCLTYFQDVRKSRLTEGSLYDKAKQIKRLSEKLSFRTEEDFYQSISNGSFKSVAEFENLLLRPKSALFSGTGMFRTLSEVILPDLITRNSTEKTINFWVPGCGNGREAYSIALFLNAQRGKLPEWSFNVLATDTSLLAIEEAKTAHIPYEDIDEIVYSLYGAGLKKSSDNFIVKEDVRDIITFSHGNFYDFQPENKPFDAIFFRGHLRFWEPNQQQAIIENLDACLGENGYMVLGAEESLLGLIGHYRQAHNVPGFYKKSQV